MDTGLTVQETLSLIFDRTDAVRVLWNFYIVVALGALGFMAKAGSGRNALRVRRLTAVGFLLFALSNVGAMHQTQLERRGLVAVLNQFDLPDQYQMLEEAVFVWPPWSVVTFHFLMSLVVVLCILWLGKRDAVHDGDA